MKMSRELTLDADDIFQALKQYIGNNVYGVNESEVCNFEIRYNEETPSKSIIEVILEDVRMKT